MNNLNAELFRIFNSAAGIHPVTDGVFAFVSEGLGVVVAFVSSAYLVWYCLSAGETKRQTIRAVFLYVFPAVLALVISEILKELIAVARPFIALDGVTVLTPHGGMDSFPSGHAIVYSALAVSAFFVHRRMTVWVASAAVVIALARIIAGVHWPFDIAVGWLIGVCVAAAFFKVFEYWKLAKIKEKA